MAPPKNPPAPLVVASGPLNTGAVAGDPVAPEFLVSVNTCTPKEWVNSHVDPLSGPVIQSILEHLVTRLNGSLDPIWDGPDGHDPEWAPRASSTPAEKDAILADEEWARWCTELMAGTVYGAASGYGAKHFTDIVFYKAFNDASNPVVPVRMACQQLCTYAYYSRGLSYAEVADSAQKSIGVTAGPNSHLAAIFDGGWDGSSKYADLTEALARKAPMAAGSILGFSPPKDPNNPNAQNPGSHVAYVLRTAPGVSKAQFLDTGAVVNGSGRSKTGAAPVAIPSAFTGSNYDNRLFAGSVSVARPPGVTCVGMGVLKPIAPAKIRAGIAAARKTRPMGTVRLAIFLRKDGQSVQSADILYVSPRLPMHDPTSAANYYGSRYVWSLRMTPGWANLEVMWEFSIPVNDLAERMIDAPRTETLATTWGKSGGTLDPFLYLSNDAQGRARFRARVTLKAVTEEKKVVQKRVPEGNLAPYDQVVKKLASVPAGKAEVSSLVQGAIVPPKYFEPW